MDNYRQDKIRFLSEVWNERTRNTTTELDIKKQKSTHCG